MIIIEEMNVRGHIGYWITCPECGAEIAENAMMVCEICMEPYPEIETLAKQVNCRFGFHNLGDPWEYSYADDSKT